MKQRGPRFVLFATLAIAACGKPGAGRGARVAEASPGLLDRAEVQPGVARERALSRVPRGTIASAEIEEENGRLVYSFDIRVEGQTGIDEVLVDADSGEVISTSHETPRQERQESKP